MTEAVAVEPIRPPCVIFDVDGTLADVSGIRHYITADAQRKNFEKFHGASIFVPPHEPVAELARTLFAFGLPVLVVTARMERWRYLTSSWLRKWGIQHDALLMRPDGDGRRDVEIKREILARIREQYTPVLAVDDNPAIVALWNEENIPVVTWPGWDHDRLATEPPVTPSPFVHTPIDIVTFGGTTVRTIVPERTQ